MFKFYFRIVSLLAFLSIALTARATEFDEYSIVKKRFDRAVAEAAPQHRIPRLSDPAFTKTIRTLSDRHRFLESRPFLEEDQIALVQICNAANQSALAYMRFDLGDTSGTSAMDQTKAAEFQQAMARNTVKFQDEITLLQSFYVQCMEKTLPLIAASTAALKPTEFNAARRNGISDMRSGIVGVVLGGAGGAADSAISMENRRKLITVTSKSAPVFSSVLDLPTRKSVHDYLESMAGHIPTELSLQYTEIIRSMSGTNCVGLCMLAGR